MSSPLQIRDVPEGTRRVLKARAAERGESLNTYLRGVLEAEAATPTVAEVLDRAARRNERLTGSSADAISRSREERETELGRSRP